MVERYPQPPLIEAIYEVFPAGAPGWSELAFTRLAARFAPEFDGEAETLNFLGVTIAFDQNKLSTPTATPEGPRRRLWKKDRSEMVQFSQHICAYNLLSGYSQFEDHTNRLETIFEAWLQEAQPAAIASTGQRYINKIVLPVESGDPAEYFTLSPRLPAPPKHHAFALQVVFEIFDGGEVVLNLAHRGEGVEDASGAVYYLDIYARSTAPVPVNAKAIQAWQAHAHPYVRRAFQSALTERCKQLFRRSQP